MRATPDNAAVDAAAPPVRLRPGQRAERLATRALHRLVPLRAQHRLRNSAAVLQYLDRACELALNFVSKAELRRASAAALCDVAYGDDSAAQCLDILGDGDGALGPVVLFVHGGAWATGSKLLYRLVGRRLAHAAGCTVRFAERRRLFVIESSQKCSFHRKHK